MDKNITIYTSNSCMYCHMAKDYLDEIDVPYEEKNVSNDERARHELAEKGYMFPLSSSAMKKLSALTKNASHEHLANKKDKLPLRELFCGKGAERKKARRFHCPIASYPR